MSGHKLHRLDAPAYWTRWAVEVDGTTIGYVERRGGFAPWTVRDADWRRIGGQSKRADAIELLKSHTTATEETPMPDTHTDDQVDAAIRAWGTDRDTGAVADIVVGTNLRDSIVRGGYLTWDESRTIARPEVRKLLADVDAEQVHLSSTTRFLAEFVQNIRDGQTPVNLHGLWNLGKVQQRVVVEALAKALDVTL